MRTIPVREHACAVTRRVEHVGFQLCRQARLDLTHQIPDRKMPVLELAQLHGGASLEMLSYLLRVGESFDFLSVHDPCRRERGQLGLAPVFEQRKVGPTQKSCIENALDGALVDEVVNGRSLLEQAMFLIPVHARQVYLADQSGKRMFSPHGDSPRGS